MNRSESDPPSQKTTPLSQELRLLAERFHHHPAKLAEVVEAVRERGFGLLLVLLCLPFLTPIPLPFLSTPFGAAITFIGLRVAWGGPPHLPRRFMEARLPPRFFPRLLGATSRIIHLLEYMLHPRLEFLHTMAPFRRLGGVLIALSGLQLLLPLPIPFSNFFPALSALLLSASTMEKDGLIYLVGCLAFCVSTAFFVLLAVGGTGIVHHLLGRP